jgi:hypothetical protein
MLATVIGAMAGGLIGCLYLTDRGRRVRGQIEPMVDTVIEELQQVGQTLDKARTAAAEGRRVVDEVLHATSSDSPWESRDLHRASS